MSDLSEEASKHTFSPEDVAAIRVLREQTGMGILDCKSAYLSADRDAVRAAALLKKMPKIQGTCGYTWEE